MTGAVMIVDDSLTVRMDLLEAFSAEGMRAIGCESIGAARAALAAEDIALAVLDVLLPDGSGVDLVKEIRATPGKTAMPILMLSSEAEVRDRILGLAIGSDDYAGKPYDRDYVVARARELLSRRVGTEPPRRAAVLVIDDSATFRAELCRALENQGYEALGAASGEEGLRSAARHRPAAIIVDGVLPGIDGATVVRRLRLDAAMRQTPCVMLTGSTLDRSAELNALDAGADAFVRKEESMELVLARLAAVLRAGSEQDRATASLLSPKRVLAVDDSRTYLDVLSATLRGEGYDVIEARSGEEALEMLAAQPVDCVLLDRIMPGLDGIETCRRIKDSAATRATPVIMLTGKETHEAIIEGLSAGADDYVLKSSEVDVLKARVRAQLRRKQIEDESRHVRLQLLHKELEASEARTEQERVYKTELERQLAELRRTKDALAKHAERLRILHEIDQGLAANQPPQAIAGAVIQPLRELLGVPRVIVNVFDMATGEVEWLAAAGRRRIHVGPGVRYSMRLMGDVDALQRGEPQFIDTRALPAGPEVDALLASGVSTYMVVPMIAGGELIGALSFGGDEKAFPPEQLGIAREVATQLAIAIMQARLFERVKRHTGELESRVAERTAELDAANRGLEDLYNRAPCGYHSADADGLIVRINDTWLAWLGYSREEVVGRMRHADLMTPASAERFLSEAFPLFRRQGWLKDMEFEYRRKDGSTFPAMLNASSLHDEAGRYVMSRATVFDISERKQSERQLLMLHEATVDIGGANGSAEAFTILLHKVCEYSGWSFGQVWLPDPAGGRLELGPSWYSRVAGLEGFRKANEQLGLAPEGGALERVWRTGQPEWVWDLYPVAKAVRRPLMIEAGLRSWIGFAVLAEGEAIAVIEFFDTELRSRDERVLGAISILAGLIGPAIQRKRAAERIEALNRDLQDLYNNAPCGYHSVDKDGLIVRMNDTELAWLGYAREEVVGQMNVRALHTPRSLERFKLRFENFRRTGVSRDADYEFKRRDGSTFSALLNATAVFDAGGNFVMSRSTVFDVTERKRAEDRIHALNESLQQHAARLEAANKELESFSYSVSHDLRAPLRAVDGFARMLQEDHGARLDEEGRRLLEVVRSSSKQMGQLIDDLLEFSRIGRARLLSSSLDMAGLAKEAAAQAGNGARASVELGELPEARGDRALLRQVWANLVSNAFKYSGRREKPVVQIGGKADGAELVYWVRDNGAGFDMRYADKLFHVFQRLHGPEEFSGTGVGLAIVQRVIARHGGRVWAEGEPDKGACFYFSLPREA